MKKTIITAMAILVLDAYLLNQGVLAMVFLLLVVPMTLICCGMYPFPLSARGSTGSKQKNGDSWIRVLCFEEAKKA